MYHQLSNTTCSLINTLNIYPCPVSEGPKKSHLGGVCPGATLPHWRPMWGSSDQGGTRKVCPKLHWSHQPRQRTATSAPAPPEQQPRPAAPLPGDQEPMAPCSRRRWGGIMPRRPGGGGVPTDCSRPSKKLPPRPSCRASSEPIQPAQGHLRQLKQQPLVSGMEGEGGVGV